jgi:hypothetical protein
LPRRRRHLERSIHSLETHVRIHPASDTVATHSVARTLPLVAVLILLALTRSGRAEETPLYAADFAKTRLGATPAAWRDLIDDRASASWAVDGLGFLRTVVKNYEGLIVYEGALADGAAAAEIADGDVEVAFKKTLDDTVAISVVGRLQDDKSYYAVRFRGFNKIELVKVKAGETTKLVDFVTLNNLEPTKIWRLRLTMRGEQVTGRVFDEQGLEQVRVDALDAEFKRGRVGLRATEFAAAQSFRIVPAQAPKGTSRQTFSAAEVDARNEATARARGVMSYAVVKPAADVASLNTPFDKLSDRYDVVVAGAGTGGSAAAIQAARMGARVLLIEESDWIGGQMSAAAVATMDEEGIWFQFPVRERGIYREFHETMVNYFYTRQIDPFRAYSSWPTQTEGGYEPKSTRAALYGLIDEARRRQTAADGRTGALDVSPRTRVTKTRKDGEAITGVTLEGLDDNGKPSSREIACRVLVEATEYGDVLPLTGARYRVGSVFGDNLKPSALLQDNTWCGVIRDYPGGIPDHLRIKSPPPDYEKWSKVYRKYQLWGNYVWGMPGKGLKGPRDWRVWVHWRGMADADGPLAGEASEFRHTQCGINGGNDYAMTVGGLENPTERLAREREGIYRTLSAIYYFQHEVGLKWALAEDEGYNTPYNRIAMKRRDLRPDLYEHAIRMPQWPYVRESRRGVGVYTLRGSDMGRFENAKHWPTSVAMGDYFMDLHRTEEELEADLDRGSWEKGDFAKGGGPFQVPLEAFIPEKVDGLVFAEKNIAQSRLVSGATRLQPITMLTGQAAGAIAGLASTRGVQPRQLRPVDVQHALLAAGSTLVPRWYTDVPWGTQTWRDSQLLSLYGMLDRPAPIHKRNGPLREKWTWGPDEPVTPSDVQTAIARLSNPTAPISATSAAAGGSSGSVTRAEITRLLAAAHAGWRPAIETATIANAERVTRREFAAVCAAVLSLDN